MSAPTKQEMLTNVENAINAMMAGGAVQSYSIAGRNLQRMQLSELIKWRDQLRREIAGSRKTVPGLPNILSISLLRNNSSRGGGDTINFL